MKLFPRATGARRQRRPVVRVVTGVVSGTRGHVAALPLVPSPAVSRLSRGAPGARRGASSLVTRPVRGARSPLVPCLRHTRHTTCATQESRTGAGRTQSLVSAQRYSRSTFSRTRRNIYTGYSVHGHRSRWRSFCFRPSSRTHGPRLCVCDSCMTQRPAL